MVLVIWYLEFGACDLVLGIWDLWFAALNLLFLPFNFSELAHTPQYNQSQHNQPGGYHWNLRWSSYRSQNNTGTT